MASRNLMFSADQVTKHLHISFVVYALRCTRKHLSGTTVASIIRTMPH